MLPAVQDSESSMTFECVAQVDPKPWHLTDLEETVDRVMRSCGVADPKATVPATAIACLVDPPCR